MAWHLKNNYRRFFRIDTEMKFIVFPKNQRFEANMAGTGVQYCSKAIIDKSKLYQEGATDLVETLPSIADTIRPIVHRIFYKLSHLIFMFESVSSMNQIKDTSEYIRRKEELTSEIYEMRELYDSSPKTHKIINAIVTKIRHYSLKVFAIMENTTSSRFAYQTFKPDTDFGLNIFDGSFEKNINTNSLLKTIKYVHLATEVVTSAIRKMNEENMLTDHVDKAPRTSLNISACGMKFTSEKSYQNGERLNVYIHLEDIDESVKFEGHVLSCEYKPFDKTHITIVDFYFPEGSAQNSLLSQVQIIEARHALLEAG